MFAGTRRSWYADEMGQLFNQPFNVNDKVVHIPSGHTGRITAIEWQVTSLPRYELDFGRSSAHQIGVLAHELRPALPGETIHTYDLIDRKGNLICAYCREYAHHHDSESICTPIVEIIEDHEYK